MSKTRVMVIGVGRGFGLGLRTDVALEDLARDIHKASEGLQDALSAAIYKESLELIGESVKRVPVRVGILRASAYAAPPKNTPRGPEGEVGYGTEYALPVHERIEVFHRVGGPKYLESVMLERIKGYKNRIADSTSKNFAAGIGVRAISSDMPTKPKRSGR